MALGTRPLVGRAGDAEQLGDEEGTAMATAVDRLTPIEKTLFLTLDARALDSRSAQPILDDATAARLAERVHRDVPAPKVSMALVAQVALRTRMLDDAVRRFVARHRDAVVVDLGAGLDTARLRVAPPSGVAWFDVDLPAVAALRDGLLPPAARALRLACR